MRQKLVSYVMHAERRTTIGAALLLGLGYADLARGGTALAAVLLAAAYCALVPLALWSGASDSGKPAARRQPVPAPPPSYGAATVAGLAVFTLYLVTLAPSTAMWDTSEYLTAAYTFGLPHPPGNPLFVIVAHVFAMVPIARTVAARVNILAALSSAVAAAMWFLVAERVLAGWLPQRWQRLAGSSLGALMGATAFTVWNQSVVNEKVYTVSLAGIAVVSWLAIRWSDEPDGARGDRVLVVIAYLCGLGYANHMAGMLPAPAVALAVLVRRPRTLVRWKLVAACAAALVLGLSPFATQPIRAAYFPALNEGQPTACQTRLEASCTFSKGTYDAFTYNFNRGQYGKPDLSDRQAPLAAQLDMWWLYFKWQWLRDPHGEHPGAQVLLAAVFLVLGVFGGWVHYRRHRPSFWYFGGLVFTVSLLLIYYLNFKYGASQDPALQAPHEVRDRDYFFLWSFSSWGVWTALGLVYVWESVAALIATQRRRIGKDTVVEPARRGWVCAAPLLLIALIPLLANWHAASHAGDRTTRDIATDLLNSVEPYGVLVTVGDNDTFPLWYAQEVEGIRRDVVVANTSLLNTDWYARQLIRRPVFDYDAQRGPALYRGTHWAKPTTPLVRMTLAQADSVPPYFQMRGPMQFTAGPIRATIDPRNLEYGALQRADIFVLRMIADSGPQRPVYFARSTGPYPRQLGLQRYLLGQGLAAKVFVPPDAPASRDTVMVEGEGWLDVPRTTALWTDVFQGPKALIDHGDWVDRPSVSMPLLYLTTGTELGTVLGLEGQTAMAQRVVDTTVRVAKAAHLEDFLQGVEAPSPAAATVPGDSARGDAARGVPLTGDRSIAQPAAPSTRAEPGAGTRHH